MTTDTKQRVTVFLDTTIAKQAKAQAIIEQLSLSILVEKALNLYLPPETVIKKII